MNPRLLKIERAPRINERPFQWSDIEGDNQSLRVMDLTTSLILSEAGRNRKGKKQASAVRS
jgi:hypothetical protein